MESVGEVAPLRQLKGPRRGSAYTWQAGSNVGGTQEVIGLLRAFSPDRPVQIVIKLPCNAENIHT